MDNRRKAHDLFSMLRQQVNGFPPKWGFDVESRQGWGPPSTSEGVAAFAIGLSNVEDRPSITTHVRWSKRRVAVTCVLAPTYTTDDIRILDADSDNVGEQFDKALRSLAERATNSQRD